MARRCLVTVTGIRRSSLGDVENDLEHCKERDGKVGRNKVAMVLLREEDPTASGSAISRPMLAVCVVVVRP